MDGTLTQTNELIFATFNYVAEKYIQKTFTPAEIIAMFGPPEEIAVENLVGKDQNGAAMADFCRFYEEHHSRMAELHPGIIASLEFLKQRKVLIALFTGKGRSTTLITLEQLNIAKYFDLIVTGSDVENHKPSADGIRKVMQTFDLLPAEVLMVGDAVADVKAAKEAGIPIAAVLWDSYAKEHVMRLEVDAQFESVAEFSSWLRTAFPPNGVAH